jgi:hypothetical protein
VNGRSANARSGVSGASSAANSGANSAANRTANCAAIEVEDRLRAASRALTERFPSSEVPPLRMPAQPAGARSVTGRRAWHRGFPWLNPLAVAPAYAGPRGRRRLYILTAAAAAVILLAVGLLTGVQPGSHAIPSTVHVNLAAWSVNTNPGGTVTFEVKSAADSAGLQRTLAEAGVRAIVRWSENCRAQGRTLPLNGIVSGPTYVGGSKGRPQIADGLILPAWAYTVTPSAMPKGATFMISVGPGPTKAGHRHWPHDPWFDWALVPAGVHVACSPSVPPAVG